jgi:hypothetical protein
MYYAIYNKLTNKPVLDPDYFGCTMTPLYTNKKQAQTACDSIDDNDYEVRPVVLTQKGGAK